MINFRILPWLGVSLLFANAAYSISPEHGEKGLSGSAAVSYVVTLKEPSVIDFESASQLSSRGKALNLRPTAPNGGRLDATDASVLAYRRYLKSRQNDVLTAIAAANGKALAPTYQWDLVGNGFSVQMSASEAAKLAQHPDVASVLREQEPVLHDFAAAQTLKADTLWLGGVPGIAASRGEGIVIGVIDRGVDTLHPAFAEVANDGYRHQNPRPSRYGLCVSGAPERCNGKVIGVYEYGTPPTPTSSQDWRSHGTAVASMALGNPVTSAINAPTINFAVPFSGVAPRANLISYGIAHGSLLGAYIAGINQAVLDGVDVINMSFGFVDDLSPWEHPISLAVLAARRAGIVVVGSAGNSGPDPGSMVDAPANSPWVTSVAAVRSNKILGMRLAGISGFGVAAPFDLVGEGIAAGVATAPMVLASSIAPDAAGCASGALVGSTSPFPPGALTGKIVVCEASGYRLTEIAGHISAAGGIALVILAPDSVGPDISPFRFVIPGLTLNHLDGNRLRSLLQNAATAGQPVSARLEVVQLLDSPVTGLVASFSARGPVAQYGGVLKPDVAAPGNDTFAALTGTSSYASFDGTSASSPAAAGAAALIRAVHPDWQADQVVSAMITTGTRGSVYLGNDVLAPATSLDEGGGMVNVAAAVRAGLHFRVANAAFENADPDIGGSPQQLNLPSIFSNRCPEQCTFTRQVEASVGGTWQAQVAFDPRAQVQVSPDHLTLAAGQSGTFTVTVTVGRTLPVGTRFDGRIRWVSTTSSSVPDTTMPINIERGIGDFRKLSLEATTTSGRQIITTRQLGQTKHVSFRAWPVQSMAGRTEFVARNEVRSFVAAAPAALGTRTNVRGKLVVSLSSATAPDLDLYVYEDDDGDGSADTRLCASIGLTSDETCEVDTLWTGRNRYIYEIRAYDSSANGDASTIAVYNHVPGFDPDLVITTDRPRNFADEVLPIDLAWNLSEVPVGAEALSFVGLIDQGEELATARVTIRRTTAALPPTILNPKTDAKIIALAPGQAHEQIIVDIPPNQTALVVRAEGVGGNVDLYASRVTSAATPPSFPTAPPRGQQAFASASAGNVEVISIEGVNLTPGRYFITPVNTGTTAATVTLSVTGLYSGSTVQPAANGYFNPARSGHGVFLAKTAQVWALAWYTFDAFGLPVWYTAQGAAAAATDGLWTAPLYRSTWDGTRDTPQEVGRVLLTFDGTGSFTYSWYLDGAYGSEPFLPIGAPQCANGNFSVGGGWLRPDQPGWGSYFLNFAGNFEAEALYLYDAQGLPRWLIGDGTYAQTLRKTFYVVRGFCPTCAFAPTTRAAVGTAERTLTSTTQGRFSSDIVLSGGISGDWFQDRVSWAKLTPDLSCAP